jgi:hypothetical protein
LIRSSPLLLLLLPPLSMYRIYRSCASLPGRIEILLLSRTERTWEGAAVNCRCVVLTSPALH